MVSKTEAMRLARKDVTPITKREQTRFVFYADKTPDDFCSGSTEFVASSYESAVLLRSVQLALCALRHMEKSIQESRAEVMAYAEDAFGPHDAMSLLKKGIWAFDREALHTAGKALARIRKSQPVDNLPVDN